jgi:hypothetical protein
MTVLDEYMAFFPDTNLNCRGKDGKTPLQAGWPKRTQQWLLHHGADVELPFSTGKTPLASFGGMNAGILLEYGAKIAPLTEDQRKRAGDRLAELLLNDIGYKGLTRGEARKIEQIVKEALRTGKQKEAKELGRLSSLSLEERFAGIKKWLARVGKQSD